MVGRDKGVAALWKALWVTIISSNCILKWTGKAQGRGICIPAGEKDNPGYCLQRGD